MGRIANWNLELAIESFFERDMDKSNKVIENESVVDYLYQNISARLVQVNNTRLSPYEADQIGKMFRILSDIERIGDHATNIAEYTAIITDGNLKFTDAAAEELKKLSDLTVKLAEKSLDAFEKQDDSYLLEIELMENEVDYMSVQFNENHLNRLIAENCEPKSGVVFTDMITDLERSADHANNIAFSII